MTAAPQEQDGAAPAGECCFVAARARSSIAVSLVLLTVSAFSACRCWVLLIGVARVRLVAWVRLGVARDDLRACSLLP